MRYDLQRQPEKADLVKSPVSLKDPVLSIMLHAPLSLFLFTRVRGFFCFSGFAFLAAGIKLRGNNFLHLVLLVSLNLLY